MHWKKLIGSLPPDWHSQKRPGRRRHRPARARAAMAKHDIPSEAARATHAWADRTGHDTATAREPRADAVCTETKATSREAAGFQEATVFKPEMPNRVTRSIPANSAKEKLGAPSRMVLSITGAFAATDLRSAMDRSPRAAAMRHVSCMRARFADGQVNHRNVCGKFFRARHGAIICRTVEHTCPTRGAKVVSTAESGAYRLPMQLQQGVHAHTRRGGSNRLKRRQRGAGERAQQLRKAAAVAAAKAGRDSCRRESYHASRQPRCDS